MAKAVYRRISYAYFYDERLSGKGRGFGYSPCLSSEPYVQLLHIHTAAAGHCHQLRVLDHCWQSRGGVTIYQGSQILVAARTAISPIDAMGLPAYFAWMDVPEFTQAHQPVLTRTPRRHQRANSVKTDPDRRIDIAINSLDIRIWVLRIPHIF